MIPDDDTILRLKQMVHEINECVPRIQALEETSEGLPEARRMALEARDRMAELLNELPPELAAEFREVLQECDEQLRFITRWQALIPEFRSIVNTARSLPREGAEPSEEHLELMRRLVSLIDQHTAGVPREEWGKLAEARDAAALILEQFDPPRDEAEH
jgi:hypothetical protein